MPGSGGGPSQGAITRASCPSPRSARARPSTWTWTPPGVDSEYGHSTLTRTASPGPGRHGGGGPVGGPVGLHQVPLLRCLADKALEPTGQLLGDPRDVVAQPARPLDGHRRPDLGVMPAARAKVDA